MGSRLSVGHHSFIRPKYLCFEVSTALSESLLRFWRNSTNSVPGFPQDAFMEGPTMAMDQMVDKPQNFGLHTGWSGFMAGMMTFDAYSLKTNTTKSWSFEGGGKAISR
jgi:hypothetical protein